MKRRHNAPTMQTIQRADGSMYHTLNTRRLRNASPLQTVMPAKRKINVISIVLIALIVALLTLALMVSSAHAQTCQIGGAPTPQMACTEPRAYLPLIGAGVLLPR